MSCSNRNLNNLDTTIYKQGCSCGCDNNSSIQYVERPINCCPCPPRPPYPPYPPFPPMPTPVPPEPVIPSLPTSNYALYTNAAATGVAYDTGDIIPFSTTVYNTNPQGIINNGAGTITLLGGTTGRTYLVNYQVSGTTATTGATVGLLINGITNAAASSQLTDGTTTANGSYIVNVPANSSVTVSLSVITGTITTGTPTTGTYLSIVRLS